MKLERNKFGQGELYDETDIKGTIFCSCTACMSIYSEFLSWANRFPERIVSTPDFADNIIVLSCQVTDLAVLNDIVTLEKYKKSYPGKTYYIGGCLAKRFDIELPSEIKRLNNLLYDGTIITNFDLVKYEKPFWVNNYKDYDSNHKDGHLFRNMYPLRIGSGCNNNCTYCTIKITRGPYKEIKYNQDEFLNNDNIVLIADSPSVQQISDWCDRSINENKPIAIRNIEPNVVRKTHNSLFSLAQRDLLTHFHCPIQHTDAFALNSMKRDPNDVQFVLWFAKLLKTYYVFTATNIIIDYLDYNNPDMNYLKQSFDYISWNPYWNGVWNRKLSEEKFYLYFNCNIGD